MNTPVTHPDPKTLTAFARGTLSVDGIEEVQRHLASCDVCCAWLENVADDSLLGLVRDASVDRTQMLGDDQTADSPDHEEHNDDQPRPTTPDELLQKLPKELHDHSRYVVLEQVGAGGMGNVYRAQHRLMQRSVALKVINREFVQHKQAVERFRREAQAAGALDHPNIVSALDAEQEGDVLYLVMEFVDGTTLHDLVRRDGRLSVSDACEYTRQVARGLQHAHERGMVHRDIKPHNLMLTNDGTVKILDFGLASLSEAVVFEDEPQPNRADLTRAGSIMGTPDYISPEQATDARAADIRSDIYSLGATLYFLLTGQPPFTEGNVMDKLHAHSEQSPDPIESIRDDIPPELSAVVRRMMSKHPADRFQSPEELANALAPFVDRHRPQAAPVRTREAKPVVPTPRPKSHLPAAAIVITMILVAIPIVLCVGMGVLWFGYRSASQEQVVRARLAEQQAINAAEAVTRERIASHGHVPPEQAFLEVRSQRAGIHFRLFAGQTAQPIGVVGENSFTTHPEIRATHHLEEGPAEANREYVVRFRVHPNTFTMKLDADTRDLVIDDPTFEIKDGGTHVVHIRERTPISIESLRRGQTNTPKQLRSIRTLGGHSNYITSLAVAPHGNRLFSGSNSGFLKVWDLQDGTISHDIPGVSVGTRLSTAVDRDGERGLTGCRDGYVRSWSLKTGKLVDQTKMHDKEIHRVAYSPTGKMMLTVSVDGTFGLRRLPKGPTLELPKRKTDVVDAGFAASRDHVILATASTVEVWEFMTDKTIREFPVDGEIVRLAIASDGQHVAVGKRNGSVAVLNLETGDTANFPQGHTDTITDLVFSANSKLLVTGGFDKQLVVWDADMGMMLAKTTSKHHVFNSIVLSRDGRLITAGGISKPPSAKKFGELDGDFKVYEWDVTR